MSLIFTDENVEADLSQVAGVTDPTRPPRNHIAVSWASLEAGWGPLRTPACRCLPLEQGKGLEDKGLLGGGSADPVVQGGERGSPPFLLVKVA